MTCLLFQTLVRLCVHWILIGYTALIQGLTWLWVNPLPSLPFCSIQRKSLDLNLQSATTPSRGKTLPTPVQLEFNQFQKWLRPCLDLVLTCILYDHTAVGPCWTAWKSRYKQPWHNKRRWRSSRADQIWKWFNTQCIQMYVRCTYWSCQASFQPQIY